jgi:hypothetical protein
MQLFNLRYLIKYMSKSQVTLTRLMRAAGDDAFVDAQK